MHKKANTEWISNLRGTDTPRKAVPKKNSKPKKLYSGDQYISPFIQESRRKALERAKQSDKRRQRQQQPWNDEFAKDKIDYFDPKTQREQIFKLKPKQFSARALSPDSAGNDDSLYGDEKYLKFDRGMTTRTTSALPQHSPQKRYGVNIRSVPSKPVCYPSPSLHDDDDSYDPLAEAEAEKGRPTPSFTRQQPQAQQNSPPAGEPQYSHDDDDSYDPMAEMSIERSAKSQMPQQQPSRTEESIQLQSSQNMPQRFSTPRVTSPTKLAVDTGMQATSSMAAYSSPAAARLQRDSPRRTQPSQTARGRERPTSPGPTRRDSSTSYDDRQNGTTSPSGRTGQGNAYRPAMWHRPDDAPLRVTTRATSPFDDRTVKQILGDESSARDSGLRSPAHKRSAHRPTGWDWPETSASRSDDPLVRVLEAHARAQEVTSQAHADVMGNISKMVTTLGRAMIAKGKRKSRPGPSTWNSAAMTWYMMQSQNMTQHTGGHNQARDTECFLPDEREGAAADENSPLPKIYGSLRPEVVPFRARDTTNPVSPQKAHTHPVPIEQNRKVFRDENHRPASDSDEAVAATKAIHTGRRRRGPPSKYEVIDHVLGKLQEMEQQEKLILNDLSATRPPLADVTSNQLANLERNVVSTTSPQHGHVHSNPTGTNIAEQWAQDEPFFTIHGNSSALKNTEGMVSNLVIYPQQLHDTVDVFKALEQQNKELYTTKGVTWQLDSAKERGLALIRPDGVVRGEIEDYKRELRRCKSLRESTFRANKVTLTETCDRLTDALMDDILTEAADELEGIFGELADKFMDKI